MLKAWLNQLGEALASPGTPDTAEDREHALRVATAALMIEVARADHSFDDTERRAMLELATRHFDLTDDEARQLTEDASDAAGEAVSVYEFSQGLHDALSVEEKAHIVGLLWKIAYADGELDKYENSLVLKISDLMFVPRGQVMRQKHDAALAAGATPPEQQLGSDHLSR